MGTLLYLLILATSVSGLRDLVDSNMPMEDVLYRYRRQATPIPSEFDCRTEWPNCPTIGFVYKLGQKFCTASWAISVAAAISDRVCISPLTSESVQLSPQDLIDCCDDCGSCYGGDPLEAWKYWTDEGIPTGGEQGSNKGCKPYTVIDEEPPDVCEKKCRPGYKGDYNQEKVNYRGMGAYRVAANEQAIQREMMDFGPVIARIWVTFSLIQFRSEGVYKTTTPRVGWQSIKLIGWGELRGEPYWLAVNSFGDSWGDGGMFKIHRGSGESGVESSVSAGVARNIRLVDLKFLEQCSQPTDVVFVVDSATASTSTQNTIGHMIDHFKLEDRYQVGIILCSNLAARTTLPLGKEQTNTKRITEFMGDYIFQYGQAPLNLHSGMREAMNQFATTGRKGAVRVLVVVTQSEVVEAGLRELATVVKQEDIWITLAVTDTTQRDLLTRVASAGLFRFITSGTLGDNIAEDDVFYILPLLLEEVCKATKLCWECMFDNGVYVHQKTGSCDEFYHCRVPGDSKPPQRRCPLGKFYDRSSLTCVWPADTYCWADPCVLNGTRTWPNANHCGAYWQCNTTILRTRQLMCCPKGQAWNQAQGSCVVDSSCNERQLCFREQGCNLDFYLTFDKGGFGDLVGYVYIDKNSVKMTKDAQAEDGWAARFMGKDFLTIRFYANIDLKDNIQIYVKFRPNKTGELIETLVTDGGCFPLEPAVFVGYSNRPNEQAAVYAYLRTLDIELELSLPLNNPTGGYTKLWSTYDGTTFKLEIEDPNGDPYEVMQPATGNIIRTKNSLKIGSSNYDYFGHSNFNGYIDEIAISRCETGYEKP